jgi:hypothetical protein
MEKTLTQEDCDKLMAESNCEKASLEELNRLFTCAQQTGDKILLECAVAELGKRKAAQK